MSNVKLSRWGDSKIFRMEVVQVTGDVNGGLLAALDLQKGDYVKWVGRERVENAHEFRNAVAIARNKHLKRVRKGKKTKALRIIMKRGNTDWYPHTVKFN